MKKSILFCLVILCFIKLSAQETEVNQSSFLTLQNFRTFVYVNKIRLDSIDAEYALFTFKSFDRLIVFDYGELYDKWKTITLTNADNVPYSFTSRTTSFILNLFYYNGWEVDNIIPTGIVSEPSQIILKKRAK